MSAFLDAARVIDDLTQRVERLESQIRDLKRGTDNPPRTHLRVREVAVMVGLKPDTIRDYIADGRLDATDMGGWFAVEPAAVEKTFAQRLARRRAVAS